MKKRTISRRAVLRTGYDLSGKRVFLIMSFLFLLGMLLGALLVRADGAQSTVSDAFSQYFSAKSQAAFFGLLFASLGSSLPFVIAAFLSGFFLLGAPVAAAVVLARGMGIGLFAGFVYAQYALQGVGFYALIMLVPLFISSVGIVYACDRAFGLSAKLFSLALPNSKTIKLSAEINKYIKSYAFVMITVAASAVLDTILSILFVKLFAF